MVELVIERIEDQAGYRACERIQREVWGFADVAIVPDHAIHTILEAGGILLGAYDGPGPGRELLGFVLSLLGRTPGGRLRHCSFMAAVSPAWQTQGVGFRLKLAQRQHVLREGIDLVTWTFDPLESRNAHFNLNKLGAMATKYMPNYYGEFRDARNRGLPTDRFLCAWHLRSERVERALGRREDDPVDLASLEMVNRTQRLPSGLRAPAGFQFEATAKRLLVEIPHDLQALRQQDVDLARAWRLETRKILPAYMDQGYVATRHLHQGDRSFLILEAERR